MTALQVLQVLRSPALDVRLLTPGPAALQVLQPPSAPSWHEPRPPGNATMQKTHIPRPYTHTSELITDVAPRVPFESLPGGHSRAS